MSAPTRIHQTASPITCALIERFAAVASYVTVNISSPNTPGLRNLQQAAMLDDLLARVIDARERVAPQAGPTPVLLKIAPDLSLPDLDDVVGIARSRRVDGMIVGNTTVTRPTSLRAIEESQRGRRIVGPAAVAAGEPHAGRNLCAGGGRFPAGRRRRHRFRCSRARQDPRRRKPHSALFRARFPRARTCRRDQGRAARGAGARGCRRHQRFDWRRCGVRDRGAMAGIF